MDGSGKKRGGYVKMRKWRIDESTNMRKKMKEMKNKRKTRKEMIKVGKKKGV